MKTHYTTFLEISPWTIQAGGRLNVENFDIRGGYFWVWGNNWGQKKKKTQTADLHVNLDNKQVCHLRVMLHISSSIPCLLNWNFSSEDNPGKIEQKIIKHCKSVTSIHRCSQPKISDSQLEGRLGEKQNSDLLYFKFFRLVLWNTLFETRRENLHLDIRAWKRLIHNQIPTAVELLQRNPTLLSPYCTMVTFLSVYYCLFCFVPAKCLYISSLLTQFIRFMHVEIN